MNSDDNSPQIGGNGQPDNSPMVIKDASSYEHRVTYLDWLEMKRTLDAVGKPCMSWERMRGIMNRLYYDEDPL
jgi:hypothetical protein